MYLGKRKKNVKHSCIYIYIQIIHHIAFPFHSKNIKHIMGDGRKDPRTITTQASTSKKPNVQLPPKDGMKL